MEVLQAVRNDLVDVEPFEFVFGELVQVLNAVADFDERASLPLVDVAVEDRCVGRKQINVLLVEALLIKVVFDFADPHSFYL